MTTTTRNHHGHAPSQPSDCHARGVAMLLVLIALVVTTVLSAGILSSRDVAPSIGANAVRVAEARFGAESAANVAVGTIEATVDWVNDIAEPSQLVNNLEFSDGTTKVMVVNMQGDEPTPDDREMLMLTMCSVEGITKWIAHMITVRDAVAAPEAIDAELLEFAAYAQTSLRMDFGGRIGVWDLSPEASAAGPVNVGLPITNSSQLAIDDAAEIDKTRLLATSITSGATLLEIQDAPCTDWWQIPLHIPLLEKSLPPAILFSGCGGGPDINLDSGANQTLPPGCYGHVNVENGATLTLDAGAGGVFEFDGMTLGAAQIVVIGQAVVQVENSVQMDDGASISYSDEDATLELYVNDQIQLGGGATIGVRLSEAGLGAAGVIYYDNPRRTRIYGTPCDMGGDDFARFRIGDGAAVIGMIHAPDKDVELGNGGTVFGRITAWELDIQWGGVLLYDPTLDQRNGFAAEDGPLYDNDGLPVDGLVEALDVMRTPGLYVDEAESLFEQDWVGGGGSATASGSKVEITRIEFEAWDLEGLFEGVDGLALVEEKLLEKAESAEGGGGEVLDPPEGGGKVIGPVELEPEPEPNKTIPDGMTEEEYARILEMLEIYENNKW